MSLGAGGSMLAGAVLGPVGALAGAVGGAIAGSRAGAAASEGICDVSASEPLLIPIFPTSDSNDSRNPTKAVDSTGSHLCNSCKAPALQHCDAL